MNHDRKQTRGYFGIAFYEPKFEENIGTAVRSANCFGADFIAVIGARYKKQASDTMATERHIPIYQYKDVDDFLEHTPIDCEIVAVECDGVKDLETFKHPQRAIYVFGGEDRSLPKIFDNRIRFNTRYCVNMAVAASITLYDRHIKQ